MNLEQDVKKSFPFWTGASSEIIDKWHTNIGFAWILDILGELVPIFSPSLSDSGEVFRVYPGFSARCVGSNPGAMGGGDPFDPFKQHGNCGNNKGNLMGISWYKQQSFGNIHGNIKCFYSDVQSMAWWMTWQVSRMPRGSVRVRVLLDSWRMTTSPQVMVEFGGRHSRSGVYCNDLISIIQIHCLLKSGFLRRFKHL